MKTFSKRNLTIAYLWHRTCNLELREDNGRWTSSVVLTAPQMRRLAGMLTKAADRIDSKRKRGKQ